MALRDIIVHNFRIKLLSFLLAAGFWFTIHTMQQQGNIDRPRVMVGEERTFLHVPITVMKSAADDSGTAVTPKTVNLTLSGPSSNMRRLSSRDIQVFVDLTDVEIKPGLVKKIQVYHPPEIMVVTIVPPEVRVERVVP